MSGLRFNRAQQIYARSLLSIRDGQLQRRAARTLRVAGALALASVLAFAGFVAAGRLTTLAFLAGALAGLCVSLWVAARAQPDRHAVLSQVCDWQRVEALVSDTPDSEPDAADVTINVNPVFCDDGRLHGS